MARQDIDNKAIDDQSIDNQSIDWRGKSTQWLLDECIRRGIIVDPEIFDDNDAMILLIKSTMKHNDTDAASNATGTAKMTDEEYARISAERDRKVRIIKNYTKPPMKRTTDDFIKFFNKRYQQISTILKSRKELQNVISINRLQGKKDRENIAIIGMVADKKESKSKHIILTVEDSTGQTEVWLSANTKELIDTAKEIVFDEVIGIIGQVSNNRVFASKILFPDVPLTKELRKARKDTYVAFVGDVHVGHKLFLKDEFERMISWLRGETGTVEQREIAKKVEYVIFTGDLVEGVGIYPDQELDLKEIDVKAQYIEFTEYVKKIPSHMQIVLIAGNHDAGRLQEPQPPIYRDFIEELYALPNTSILSNPSYFIIAQDDDHPGFEVLLYHGYSIIYYANNVMPIREAGGQKATEKIMKLYLQKRHLAPSHGSNTYVPDPQEDPLVIDRVPDFLVTGHIHRVSYANYKGVTMLNASCWSEESEEQEKRGLEAQPARLPLVNLKTRELRIMNFYHGSEEKKAKLQAEVAQSEAKPI